MNAPMLVGVASAASLVSIAWITGRTRLADAEVSTRVRERLGAAILAVVCVTIGLSIEVERAVAAVESGGRVVWPPRQLVQIGWTILWLAAALAIPPLCRLLDRNPATHEVARGAAGVIGLVLCAKLIVIDTLSFQLSEGRVPATPLINLQTLAALAVMVGLWVMARWNRGTAVGAATAVACALVPLVVGSVELDRLFGPEKTLVALSVYWGLFAIGLIVVGFVLRTAALRFAGLGLLGLTLLKILVMDLANAGTGWRILRFIAVGLILLATSVLYGKLSPVILEQLERGRDERERGGT